MDRIRSPAAGTSAAALAALCALLAGGQTAGATATGLSCFIERQDHAGGLASLQAVVQAGGTALDGSYRLTVGTAGRAGRSQSVQTGNIHLQAGELRAVGTVTIGTRGARIDAELTVLTDAGAACTAQL